MDNIPGFEPPKEEPSYFLVRPTQDKSQPTLFHSESGVSTPLPIPDLYTKPIFKHPGLDTAHGSTGVIWATEQAQLKGYHPDDASKFV